MGLGFRDVGLFFGGPVGLGFRDLGAGVWFPDSRLEGVRLKLVSFGAVRSDSRLGP